MRGRPSVRGKTPPPPPPPIMNPMQKQQSYCCITMNKAQAQGRNEVRWRPGQGSCLASPCSNLRSFGSKFTVLKKVFVTLFATFWRPRSDLALGDLCPPCSPSYTPLHRWQRLRNEDTCWPCIGLALLFAHTTHANRYVKQRFASYRATFVGRPQF